MGNKCIPERKGQRKDKMFQEHLSCPSGECAWCHPDLAGSVKADYCGKHEESYWYFQTEACLTGRRGGWLENQPGWGRRDRKCWGEHPQSSDIVEVLNSHVLGYPSCTACVCLCAHWVCTALELGLPSLPGNLCFWVTVLGLDLVQVLVPRCWVRCG